MSDDGDTPKDKPAPRNVLRKYGRVPTLNALEQYNIVHTRSASANAAIATIDALRELGSIKPTDAEWYTKTLMVVGNLDPNTRLGVSKMADEQNRVPSGVRFRPGHAPAHIEKRLTCRGDRR